MIKLKLPFCNNNLFDINLWYGLREINVLKRVNKCLFSQKLEKKKKPIYFWISMCKRCSKSVDEIDPWCKQRTKRVGSPLVKFDDIDTYKKLLSFTCKPSSDISPAENEVAISNDDSRLRSLNWN